MGVTGIASTLTWLTCGMLQTISRASGNGDSLPVAVFFCRNKSR